MERMTRAQAIDAGLSKYYTGIPCINGHDSYRYTSSSACYGCVKDASTNSREKMKKFSGRNQRREFRDSTKRVVLRCVAADLYKLLDVALAVSKVRCGFVMPRDVLPNTKGYFLSAGAANYYFKAHPDDHGFLRSVAAALYEANGPKADIAAARQVAMLAGAAMAAPPPLPDGVDSIR